MTLEDTSSVVAKEPCPDCGSRDNLARYSDGHAYCFTPGCERFEPGDGQERSGAPKQASDLLSVDFPAAGLRKRRLTQETLQAYGYGTADYKGQTVQVAPYRHPQTRQVIAQKLRFANDKERMPWLGTPKEAGLFGQHLSLGTKRLVVTEGELDALSVFQAFGGKWPVVSIPNGAGGALKDLKRHLDYLQSFEEVVLFFDMDEPGQAAAQQCAEMLSGSVRVKVASITGAKDASDLMQAGREADIRSAVYGAREYRPDGVFSIRAFRDRVVKRGGAIGLPYPWAGLNELTRGARKKELVVFCAGTGIGKSAIVREVAFHLHRGGYKVGMLMLEESVDRTVQGFVGLDINKPIHVDQEGLSEQELFDAFDRVFPDDDTAPVIWDHWGSTEIERLTDRVRFMAKAEGVDFIFLDHISIVVSGTADSDERKDLDVAMTALRKIAEECNVGIFVVSHLRKPAGDKGFEEGLEVNVNHLRGSQAISQLADFVIAAQRNQKHPTRKNWTQVVVLKNRLTGENGPACWLEYSKETGRLTEGEPPEEDTKRKGRTHDESDDF